MRHSIGQRVPVPALLGTGIYQTCRERRQPTANVKSVAHSRDSLDETGLPRTLRADEYDNGEPEITTISGLILGTRVFRMVLVETYSEEGRAWYSSEISLPYLVSAIRTS